MRVRLVGACLAGALFAAACGGGEPAPATAPGLANPASVYCEEQGGTVEIREGGDGQYGVCVFPDGSECEEWAFFRGECQAGG